ncbi:complex I NDUFA9 subunit family protein [Pacificimonas sp. WHA3]|uniref:Complex I NDUFA9 subunit family protein n=1 Tax=Pacificimonas pallii TaxID=2827236 RepID=A0ABS6SA66_9SPHN|nr:complex I NDUFA9 subunit family protein [Pacificimonas pallii]MBV7255268.1 complex I NDUFA9 subunit family protein [Pacificimonas pallii]
MTELVTIFGASGFIGRYVVQELAKRGARIRAVTRDPHTAQVLKPLAGLGQLGFAKASLTDEAAIAAACEGAAAVVNLIGILDGSTADFELAQRDGPRRIAKAAAAAGAKAFVQISAIGADADDEDGPDYARTKGEGEAAVKAAFPSATIIRPSIVFGPEDDFLNRFAGLMRIVPVMPVVAPQAQFQPVFVNDLAEAIAAAAMTPEIHGGKTYEIGGPDVMTMKALFGFIARAIARDVSFVDVPDAVAGGAARALGWMPGAPMTHDQWLMLQKPNVVAGENGLKAFGISPTPMQAVAPGWLVRFRRQGRFTEAA